MLVSAWPGVSRMHLDDEFSELGFGFRNICWILDLLLGDLSCKDSGLGELIEGWPFEA